MGKRMTLRGAFWRFLCLLLIGLLVAVLLPFVVLTGCVNAGFATSANYSEASAKEIAPIFAAAPDWSKVKLPMGVQYVVLDLEFQILSNTLEDMDLARAIAYATTGETDANSKKQYLLVNREEEIIVLQYYIGSQFTNQWMREHFPTPETLFMGWIVLNIILICMVLTAGFARKLRRELGPVFAATKKVAEQNLDFQVGRSGVKEFQEVLEAFEDMKDSLKESLEQQWRAEAVRREQIASLAHDLKTPLTIIQGNADLLGETVLNGEQQNYAAYLSKSSEQMERYIKMLIEISRADMGYHLQMEKVAFLEFIEYLKMQVIGLCEIKGIDLQMSIGEFPQYISVDRQLLERALMNVINNALDYSPKEGIIKIDIMGDSQYLQIKVMDQGPGFSREALCHGKEQFYMADDSRSSKLHFGMGLFIAETIMKQHGGELELGNAAEGGAVVTIRVPVRNMVLTE